MSAANDRGPFDLAVVGAGIVGLACALAAARLGKRVIVIDRDAQANGASVRNFGFVTVTGQQRGEGWRRAMRSRDVWAEIAPEAGIEIVHRGLIVAARRAEAGDVLTAFASSKMGEQCTLHDGRDAKRLYPEIKCECAALLYSPHELRVESRDAIPRLAAWLARAHGVTFLRQTAVTEADPPRIRTSRGVIEAAAAIVCPGDDFHTLFAERITPYDLQRCKLQMLRVVPPAGFRIPASVMTDLSLVRYLGYAELPQADRLRVRLQSEQAAHLELGVHLIAVQSSDGTLVVGDSHAYAATPDPFDADLIDRLILDEYRTVFGHEPAVVERWCGTYSSAADRLAFIDAPSDTVRLVVVTSGTGASTAFAIGEEAVAQLYR